MVSMGKCLLFVSIYLMAVSVMFILYLIRIETKVDKILLYYKLSHEMLDPEEEVGVHKRDAIQDNSIKDDHNRMLQSEDKKLNVESGNNFGQNSNNENKENDKPSNQESTFFDQYKNMSHPKFKMPPLDGENVISMSLWGSDRRYTNGAIRNAELVPEFYPGWKLRIYTEQPTDNPKFGIVPKDVRDKLRSLGADLFYIDAKDAPIPPMMWRFLVADDVSIERFIIRDCDSRLSARDAAAVYAWVLSEKPFHCVRDHPSHVGYALSGGMWGGKPGKLRTVFRRPFRELMYGYSSDYFKDMDFLIKIVWPKVKDRHVFCSDSVSCEKWEGSYPFPVPRHGYEHVGQVFDEHDLGRWIDEKILKDNPVVKQCVPPQIQVPR